MVLVFSLSTRISQNWQIISIHFYYMLSHLQYQKIFTTLTPMYLIWFILIQYCRYSVYSTIRHLRLWCLWTQLEWWNIGVDPNMTTSALRLYGGSTKLTLISMNSWRWATSISEKGLIPLWDDLVKYHEGKELWYIEFWFEGNMCSWCFRCDTVSLIQNKINYIY